MNDFFHLVPKFFVRQQNPCSLTAILHSSEHLILQMSFVIRKMFRVSDANKVAKTNKRVVTKFSNLLQILNSIFCHTVQTGTYSPLPHNNANKRPVNLSMHKHRFTFQTIENNNCYCIKFWRADKAEKISNGNLVN